MSKLKIVANLFELEWLQFWRSPDLVQKIIQNTILGIIGVYFFINTIALGYLFELLNVPQDDLLSVATSGLLYYFYIDFVVRMFLQGFPTLKIKWFLTLPVKKATLAHGILLRSIFNFYNFLPFFFLIPFLTKYIIVQYSFSEVISLTLMTVGLTLFNNYFCFFLRKEISSRNIGVMLLIVLITIFIISDFTGVINSFSYVVLISEQFISKPILCVIPLFMTGLSYANIHNFLIKHSYLDSGNKRNDNIDKIYHLNTASVFNNEKIGELINIEIKLILRSKRAKSYLFLSLSFLFFPLLVTPLFEDSYTLLILGLLTTGMFAINYGQLMLSWNSTYFDLLQSSTYTYKDIFKSKYIILATSCVISFILSLPYAYFSISIIIFNFVMMLYNMSISIYTYMLLASYNSLKINPNEEGVLSMNGFGAAHYLIILPLMLIPYLTFFIGEIFIGAKAGLIIIGIISFTGIILYDPIINILVNNFKEKKYIIGAAFRK